MLPFNPARGYQGYQDQFSQENTYFMDGFEEIRLIISEVKEALKLKDMLFCSLTYGILFVALNTGIRPIPHLKI